MRPSKLVGTVDAPSATAWESPLSSPLHLSVWGDAADAVFAPTRASSLTGAIGERSAFAAGHNITGEGGDAFFGRGLQHFAVDAFSCCSSEPGQSPGQTTVVTASPALSVGGANGPAGLFLDVAAIGTADGAPWASSVGGDDLSTRHSESADAAPENGGGDEVLDATAAALIASRGPGFDEAVFDAVDAMVRAGARASSAFHRKATPADTPSADSPFYRKFVLAIVKSPLCSGEALVIALVLMARLQRVHALSAISPTTVRRVFACCAMIAAKLHDDFKSFAVCFAHAANVPVHLLLLTERQVLSRLSYSTWVEPAEFAAMATAVANLAANHATGDCAEQV